MKDLTKLWPLIRIHRGKIPLILIMGVVMSLCDTSVAVIVKPLFDELFVKKNNDLKIILSLSIVGIYFIRGIARFIHMFYLRMLGEYVCSDLRLDLQKKYTALNLSYHSMNPSGVLLSKTLNDINFVQQGMGRIADIFIDPIELILFFGWILYLDWKLTLVIFVIAPVIVKILRQLSRSARKYGHRQQEALEQVTTTFKETLDGIRIIQSFNLEKITALRLLKNLTGYLDMRRLIISREESAGPITEFIGALTIAGVFFYNATLVIQGKSTIGSFMSYLTALAFIQKPIKSLQDFVIKTQVMAVATNRIFDVLNDKSEVSEIPNPNPFPMGFQKIQFKNVSFQYNDSTPLIKNINITVNRGEVVALVGESGSGKTTLVNLLERFYDPSKGEILIDDMNIDQISLKQLRQNIALVTQDVFLFDDTIDMNIRSGNFDHETVPVKSAAQMANANDFITKTPQGYESRAGDRGARFSGGEKQRISIARAIYKNAPILVLDEATSALDSQSELEVQKGLEQLIKGRTVFVIAHRLATIVNADRILVLKNGEVVETGKHNELIEKKGAYYNFYQLQSFER